MALRGSLRQVPARGAASKARASHYSARRLRRDSPRPGAPAGSWRARTLRAGRPRRDEGERIARRDLVQYRVEHARRGQRRSRCRRPPRWRRRSAPCRKTSRISWPRSAPIAARIASSRRARCGGGRDDAVNADGRDQQGDERRRPSSTVSARRSAVELSTSSDKRLHVLDWPFGIDGAHGRGKRAMTARGSPSVRTKKLLNPHGALRLGHVHLRGCGFGGRELPDVATTPTISCVGGGGAPGRPA